MQDQTTLLSIKHLQVSFPGEEKKVVAIADSIFEISQGEILGIVGESGSGKSLTALSIMGLLPENAEASMESMSYHPLQYEITQFQSGEFKKLRGKEIGMIFQEPMSSLNPVLSCGNQLLETIQKHQKINKLEAKKKAYEWLNHVGLIDAERIFTAYPHQLSGGQKQRVMIAIAMCCNPKLLIADEPTTALDVSIQKKILELLKSVGQQWKTSILFISHDLAVIAELADRVLVMQNGHIVEEGKTEHIFRNPKHPYTQGLIACRPVLGKKYHRLPTVEDFLAGNKTISLGQSNEERTFEKKLVEIKGLSVHYPQKEAFWKPKTYFEALKKVDLDIFLGETLGLVGESGCGKSTLARVIANLQDYYEGSISIDGLNYKQIKDKRSFYQDVQIIFQNPYGALNPSLPIGNAIVEAMKVHERWASKKEREEKAVELLEKVGLKAEDFIKYPQEFSGGQRQRICIARALTVEPKFLVCDEVVSALDVSVQAQVLNLLKDLQDQYQLTYLFISHDLSVIQFMSDRIAVMSEGEIVERGLTEQIYNNPRHDYTKMLLEAIPGQ